MEDSGGRRKVLTNRDFVISLRAASDTPNREEAICSIIWDALKEGGEHRTYVATLPQPYVSYYWVWKAILESPSFDKEAIVNVFNNLGSENMLVDHDLDSILVLEEFDVDIFVSIFKATPPIDYAQRATYIEKFKVIPSDWWVELYCSRASSKDGHLGGESIKFGKLILTKLRPAYPGMPDEWLKKMLRSFAQAGSKEPASGGDEK